MASLDIDLYDFVFRALGVTNLSGDPVWDAVTKLLLPLIVLYMYIAWIVGKSRFGGWKTDTIMAFIIGFIIIYKGYFAIFADLSIYLLGFIMAWHVISFVLSGRKKDAVEQGSTGFAARAQMGSGGSGGSALNVGGWASSIGRRSKIAYHSWNLPELDAAKKELALLAAEWANTEIERRTNHWDKLPESISTQRAGIQKRAYDAILKFEPVTRAKLISDATRHFPAEASGFKTFLDHIHNTT